MLCNSIASDEFFKANGCTQFVCKFVYEKHKKISFPNILQRMTERIYKTIYEKNVNEKEKKI